MTDWFERYMKVNLTARLTMIARWLCHGVALNGS